MVLSPRLSALLGAHAPGLGSSSAKHRQIRSNNSFFPFWLCDFYGKNSLTLLSMLQAWCSLWQSSISAFLKHVNSWLGFSGCNLCCVNVCICGLLRNLNCFVPSLCPLCTYPLLLLSFCSQFSQARSLVFFHLLVEINNLRPRSVSWDKPVGKNLSRDFLFTIPSKRSIDFFNPFNVCHVNFVLVN